MEASSPPELPDDVREEVTRVHLRPTARVAEGRWLGSADGVHALIDLSDGLATDLGHIAAESGVTACVELVRLPVAASAAAVGKALGLDSLRLAVTGGEDYELLFTAPPASMEVLAAGLRSATGTPVTLIGEIVAGSARVEFRDAAGRVVDVGSGFEHFHG